MKRWILAVGLILIFFGALLWLQSTVTEQKPVISWNDARTVVDSLEVSANFTAGEVVALRVGSNYQWRQEPGAEDTSYLPTTYVFLNITGPQGKDSQYEIDFVKDRNVLSVYNVYLRIAGGFSGDYGNETLRNQDAIVGKVLYTGEYKARVWGVMPPPGGIYPPNSLAYQRQVVVTVTEHPYSDIVKAAYALFILGAIVTAFSFMPSRAKTATKRKAHAK